MYRSGRGEVADDEFVILVVKMVYGKMSARNQQVSPDGLRRYMLASCRHLAVHHFQNKDN